MKHGLDIVWLLLLLLFFSFLWHVTQFQINCLTFGDFLFFLNTLHWWPFLLFTVYKSYGFDSDHKNLLFGFLFHFFTILRNTSSSYRVWAFSLQVFTATSSKLITYAIIMHTRHKNQNCPMDKLSPWITQCQITGYTKSIYAIFCVVFVWIFFFTLLGKGKVSLLCYLWRNSRLSIPLVNDGCSSPDHQVQQRKSEFISRGTHKLCLK